MLYNVEDHVSENLEKLGIATFKNLLLLYVNYIKITFFFILALSSSGG